MSGYPSDPGFKDADTGRAAADCIAPEAPRLRSICLDALKAHTPDCATADEIAAELGRSVLAIRPRFSELVRQGLIRDTGARRQNESGCSAKVWRATFL